MKTVTKRMLSLNLALLFSLTTLLPCASAFSLPTQDYYQIDGTSYNATISHTDDTWAYIYHDDDNAATLSLASYTGGSIVLPTDTDCTITVTDNSTIIADDATDAIICDGALTLMLEAALAITPSAAQSSIRSASVLSILPQNSAGLLTIDGTKNLEASGIVATEIYLGDSDTPAGAITIAGGAHAFAASCESLHLYQNNTYLYGGDEQQAIIGATALDINFTDTSLVLDSVLYTQSSFDDAADLCQQVTSAQTVALASTAAGNFTLDGNGGSYNDFAQASLYSSATTLNCNLAGYAFVRSGYQLVGWSLSATPAATDEIYAIDATISLQEGDTLYAQWERYTLWIDGDTYNVLQSASSYEWDYAYDASLLTHTLTLDNYDGESILLPAIEGTYSLYTADDFMIQAARDTAALSSTQPIDFSTWTTEAFHGEIEGNRAPAVQSDTITLGGSMELEIFGSDAAAVACDMLNITATSGEIYLYGEEDIPAISATDISIDWADVSISTGTSTKTLTTVYASEFDTNQDMVDFFNAQTVVLIQPQSANGTPIYGNGGTLSNQSSLLWQSDAVDFTQLPFVRDGYVLVGWSDAPNATADDTFFMPDGYADALDYDALYAQWQPCPYDAYALLYTVAGDGVSFNEGSFCQVVEAGVEITLPNTEDLLGLRSEILGWSNVAMPLTSLYGFDAKLYLPCDQTVTLAEGAILYPIYDMADYPLSSSDARRVQLLLDGNGQSLATYANPSPQTFTNVVYQTVASSENLSEWSYDLSQVYSATNPEEPFVLSATSAITDTYYSNLSTVPFVDIMPSTTLYVQWSTPFALLCTLSADEVCFTNGSSTRVLQADTAITLPDADALMYTDGSPCAILGWSTTPYSINNAGGAHLQTYYPCGATVTLSAGDMLYPLYDYRAFDGWSSTSQPLQIFFDANPTTDTHTVFQIVASGEDLQSFGYDLSQVSLSSTNDTLQGWLNSAGTTLYACDNIYTLADNPISDTLYAFWQSSAYMQIDGQSYAANQNASGDGWVYQSSDYTAATLTLDGYNGGSIRLPIASTVQLSSDFTITADSNMAAFACTGALAFADWTKQAYRGEIIGSDGTAAVTANSVVLGDMLQLTITGGSDAPAVQCDTLTLYAGNTVLQGGNGSPAIDVQTLVIDMDSLLLYAGTSKASAELVFASDYADTDALLAYLATQSYIETCYKDTNSNATLQIDGQTYGACQAQADAQAGWAYTYHLYYQHGICTQFATLILTNYQGGAIVLPDFPDGTTVIIQDDALQTGTHISAGAAPAISGTYSIVLLVQSEDCTLSTTGIHPAIYSTDGSVSLTASTTAGTGGVCVQGGSGVAIAGQTVKLSGTMQILGGTNAIACAWLTLDPVDILLQSGDGNSALYVADSLNFDFSANQAYAGNSINAMFVTTSTSLMQSAPVVHVLRNAVSCTIYGNNGTFEGASSVIATAPLGSYLDLSDYVPQRAGYALSGWRVIDADKQSTFVEADAQVLLSGTCEIYAIWEALEAPATLTDVTLESEAGSQILTFDLELDTLQYTPETICVQVAIYEDGKMVGTQPVVVTLGENTVQLSTTSATTDCKLFLYDAQYRPLVSTVAVQ